jgi:chromosome segregation ATPase
MSLFEKERIDLLKRVDSAEFQRAAYDRKITELERKQCEGRSLLEQKTKQFDSLSAEKDKIINENEKLAVEIAMAKKQLFDAEKRCKELEEMRESFKRDMDSKGKETFELIERIEQLEMQVLNVKDENSALREKEERMQSELMETRDEFSSMLSAQTTKKEEEESKYESVLAIEYVYL